jgi:ankyrin repeat protein
LEYGVNPQERDTDGNTVLHLAVQCGSAELCEILLNKYNIDPSLPNNSGQSAVDLVQKSGNDFLKKFFTR